jgi:hypothetical protein
MADLRLGGLVDAATHERTETDATLPSGDLTTHGVIVGMTGSGKTGLGMVLIEECLASGVPALLIDPKGDLTNIALTFPELAAAEFEPWVDPGDAAKAGQSVPEFAAGEAQRWTTGLAGWGLAAGDVRHLHDAADVTIYTPGSGHGVALNIIGTLDVPADMGDPQAVQEEIDAYVSSLLNLVGIEADPLSSREHILLSTLINHAWSQGRALDLATLVASVQQPPVRKVGVLEVDAYYPPDERMKLALKLNGLLASPAFAAWLGGQRIDIQSMLRTPDGAPRCAVITTAHLDDEQRQSATSVILAKLISWMRRQSGTSDLRALLYMDEVAGYLPPVGNPPTKEPLMLLLKQARAFGVGVVLSTQNPVDVDYKALSNAGTWLVGRLQTEQDKARLLDGLTSAAGTVDTGAASDTISGLAKREFLMKRASRDVVEVLTTRWAMSYLRGPLTREQVSALAASATTPVAEPTPAAPVEIPTAPAAAPAAPASAPSGLAADETPVAPTVADGIPVTYLDPAASWAASVGAVPGRRLAPAVVARVEMRFDEAKADLTHDQVYEAVLFPVTASPRPEDFVAVDYDDRDLLAAPPDGAVYQLAPAQISTKSWWSGLRSALTDHLYRTMSIEVPANAELKLYGRVGESAEEFADRCQAAAMEQADAEVAALQSKYERRIADKERQLGTAERAVDRQEAQRTSTLASDMLGGLFGRSSLSASARRASSAQNRVAAARDKVEDLQSAIDDLRIELDEEASAIRDEWASHASATSMLEVPLEKTDVKVASIGLVWIPMGCAGASMGQTAP